MVMRWAMANTLPVTWPSMTTSRPATKALPFTSPGQTHHVAGQDDVVVDHFAGGDFVAADDGLGQSGLRRPGDVPAGSASRRNSYSSDGLMGG
jgi:hypothetical protein